MKNAALVKVAKSALPILICSAVILAMGLALGSYRFGSANATLQYLRGNRILVDHPVQDVGSLPDDTRREVSYRITNLTSAPVKILGLHSSCSCLVPGTPPEVIGPGQSAVLTVEVHASRRLPVIDAGLDIFTSDPAKSVLRVGVTGTVAVDVPPKSPSTPG